MKAIKLSQWRVALVLTLVLALLIGVSAAIAGSTNDPDPQSVTAYKTITLYTGNGITQTANGNEKFIGAYGIQDCYQTVDVASTQTITGALQHSADGTNWVTNYTFGAVSADATSFTRTAVYGLSVRYSVAGILTSSNPVTVSVVCVYKNN